MIIYIVGCVCKVMFYNIDNIYKSKANWLVVYSLVICLCNNLVVSIDSNIFRNDISI